MSSAVSDPAQVRQLARTMAGRVAGLLRPLADQTAIPVPNSQWTVGEHGAHLAFTKDLMARMVAGEPLTYADATREALAAKNLEVLGGFGERNGQVLAGLIEAAVDRFCSTAEVLPGDRVVGGPIGPIDVDTFTSYVLTHLMMHGEAVARALGQPSILDRQSVIGGVPFVRYVFEKFADPKTTAGLTAAYAVHLRGGPTFHVTFDRGRVTISDTRVRKVDCHISADPVAFFKVGIRLIPQWGPIAGLKLVAWGRKPWLAFRFAGTFLPP